MSPFKEKDRNRHLSKEDTHEKMLTITYYQRNAYQNYNEVSSHTDQNGYHQKSLQTMSAGKNVEKREPPCTVGGNVNCYTHYRKQYGDFFKNQE